MILSEDDGFFSKCAQGTYSKNQANAFAAAEEPEETEATENSETSSSNT